MTGGHFTRTYELWRNIVVQDPVTGDTQKIWDKVGDVPGRAYPASVTDTIIAATQVGVITWTFACSPDSGVKIGDEIHFDGRELRVQAVPLTSSGQRCECRCTEVQGLAGSNTTPGVINGGNAFSAGPGAISGGSA